MSFERISFADLFHEGFALDAERLLAHMLFLDEARPYVRSALLLELVESTKRPALPTISEEEVQCRFDEFQSAIDFIEAPRIERLLKTHGVGLDDLGGALYRDMRVERIVDAKIARAQTDHTEREAIFWQAFIRTTLRAHLVRAASIEQLGRDPAAPAQAAVDRIREHVRCRHALPTWSAVEERLLVQWAMKRETLADFLGVYARALR